MIETRNELRRNLSKELGLPVPGWSERQRPDGSRIDGRLARLEKLDPVKHRASLWAAIEGADDMWDYLPYGPFHDEAMFDDWLSVRAELADPFYYAVVDQKTDRALGCITLMEIRPAAGVIEVGHIFYSPKLQRTPIATEAIYLAGRIVFEQLGYRRFEWKCNELNAPSKRAALRYGFTWEGLFRQHLVVKGRNRDTAWYAMLDSEWPARKANYERWLAPDNFDAAGRQRVSLLDLQEGVKS